MWRKIKLFYRYTLFRRFILNTMEINIQEILTKHQKLVAIKHNIGESLVMGHKKSYYDEASKNAIKDIVEAVLLEAQDKHLKLIEEKDKEYDALENMWLDEKAKTKLLEQQVKELERKIQTLL